MNIMITGASGGYGSLALRHLKRISPNDNIFALVRDAEQKREIELQGFETRIADYGNIDMMIRSFEGIDRLLFVSVPVFDLQKNVVEAIKLSKIKFVAYTSLCHPEYQKFGLETNHLQTESLIRSIGIPHTFLRNSWYMEIIMPMLVTAAKTGDFLYYAKDAKISWTAKNDLAEAGAKVIANGCDKDILELSGNAVSFEELAGEIETVINKSLNIHCVSKDEFIFSMKKAGISDMGLTFATVWQDYAIKGKNGESELTADILESVIGHKAMTAADMLKSELK